MQRGNTNTTRFKAGLAQRAKPSPITKARLQLSDATGPLCIASVPIRERRKYLTDRICALAIPGLGWFLTPAKSEKTRKTIQCQNTDSSPPTLGPISLQHNLVN